MGIYLIIFDCYKKAAIITAKTVKSQFIIETTSQHIEHNIKVCEALTNDYNIKKDPFNNEQDFFFTICYIQSVGFYSKIL